MAVIKEKDFIQSIAESLQYISCFHSEDFILALRKAFDKEQSQPARDAIAQILINSGMCAYSRRPICQDTGSVNIFLKIGMNVKWETDRSLEDMINEAVGIAYKNPVNTLRASMVTDPDGRRKNTDNNTPAIINMSVVPGNKVDIYISAKGGGSEAKTKFAMLNPSDDISEWVLNVVPTMGAGWCPPGIIGIGIGGSPDKAMLMAKEALFDRIDIHELMGKKPLNRIEELRLELYEKINRLGIGAQGLGGVTTVLDVKIKEYPTHAANKPVALIPNCAATRHTHFYLDGSGPAVFEPPKYQPWLNPDVDKQDISIHVDLDKITSEEIISWQSGQKLLISGKLLTGRDAAHKRIVDMLDNGEPLPVDFKNRFIYYVGPVEPVGDEIVGPAGPTTATRMDKFIARILEDAGVIGMIGKAERGPDAIKTIKKNKSVYLTAVGGAAYLISKSVIKAEVLAFEDLGMEAIFEFEIKDMPVTVAVDSDGNSLHDAGPKYWNKKLQRENIA